jgi:hypothetical protein
VLEVKGLEALHHPAGRQAELEIIAPDGVPKTVASTRWSRPANTPTRWSTRWSATRNWCRRRSRTQGKLAFPWSYGVVLTNITRKQFQDSRTATRLEPHRVLCQDEMLESVGPRTCKAACGACSPTACAGHEPAQMDRVRWIMFPQVRVQTTGRRCLTTAIRQRTVPDIMRVMDIQQEQLARSLGDGHRVIHGVAGSGKTMILGYRAEYLAKAGTPGSKPILILCFNEPLGVKLHSVMEAKGLSDRCMCATFTNGAASNWWPLGRPCPANSHAGGRQDGRHGAARDYGCRPQANPQRPVPGRAD